MFLSHGANKTGIVEEGKRGSLVDVSRAAAHDDLRQPLEGEAVHDEVAVPGHRVQARLAVENRSH